MTACEVTTYKFFPHSLLFDLLSEHENSVIKDKNKTYRLYEIFTEFFLYIGRHQLYSDNCTINCDNALWAALGRRSFYLEQSVDLVTTLLQREKKLIFTEPAIEALNVATALDKIERIIRKFNKL